MSIDQSTAEGYPPAWRPEPGDEIAGIVTALDQHNAGWSDYVIVTLQPDAGQPIAVHAFHSVLGAELAKHRPKIGERLSIRYRGQANSAAGQKYHGYVVRVERDEQLDFWGEPVEPATAAAASTSTVRAADDDTPPF